MLTGAPKRERSPRSSTWIQFFGEVVITARSAAMTVTLRDVNGAVLYRKELPERA
jgi:hypothetical protein